MKRLILALLALSLVGCTVIDRATVPGAPFEGRDVFVSTGDLKQPYQSLGPLQVTTKGVYVFGFIDPVGLTLDRAVNEALVPEIRRMGGDGIINVRFEETQYLTVTRVFFAFPFFFIPLPGEVTVRGEVVRVPREYQPLPPGGLP